jgi:hypothetical protein
MGRGHVTHMNEIETVSKMLARNPRDEQKNNKGE